MPGKEVESCYTNGKLTSTDTYTYKVYSEPVSYSMTFKYDKNGTKRLLTMLGKTKSSTDGYADGNSGSYSLNDKKVQLKAKKCAKLQSSSIG